MILNGWVFFSIGQFLLWKGQYLQINDLKRVSVFFNWAILFWKGKYRQVSMILNGWVFFFFNWAILLWKRLYKPNGWVLNCFFSICVWKSSVWSWHNHTQKTLRLCSLSSSWLCWACVRCTHTHTHKKERIIVVKNWQFYLHHAPLNIIISFFRKACINFRSVWEGKKPYFLHFHIEIIRTFSALLFHHI